MVSWKRRITLISFRTEKSRIVRLESTMAYGGDEL